MTQQRVPLIAYVGDLETMGINPNSAIISIGVTKVDLNAESADDCVLSTFYQNVDLLDAIFSGMEVDHETVKWWSEQDKRSQSLLTEKPVRLKEALEKLNVWLNNGTPKISETDFWCKGTSFDIAVLRSAYKLCGMKEPWDFRRERDMRTYTDICTEMFGYEVPKSTGCPHYALDDAVHQSRVIWACRQMLFPNNKPIKTEGGSTGQTLS